MAVEAPVPVQLTPSPTGVAAEPAPEPLCALGLVAQFLALLLGRPVELRSVYERAVSLGLLRASVPAPDVPLTLRTVSRLLLAGYRVPAAVEAATPARRARLLASGWLVYEGFPRNPTGVVRRIVPSDVDATWPAEESVLFVAAPSWDALPVRGTTFLAGSRGPGGIYHWDTAECDTDATGCIVGF